jgi:hypothetical protein
MRVATGSLRERGAILAATTSGRAWSLVSTTGED